MSGEAGLVRFIVEQQNRLSCIIRYNNTPKVNGESVAEHSFYVALMAMVISDYLVCNSGIKIDQSKLIRMALIHDVEEIISGDIIKVLKSGGFKEELEKMNERSMVHITGQLPYALGGEYMELWRENKAELTIEAKLCDFCDWLAVVVYSIKEVHLGNEYFREILEYAVEKFGHFAERVPELAPLVVELASYSVKYLLKDPRIIESINKAVRIYKGE